MYLFIDFVKHQHQTNKKEQESFGWIEDIPSQMFQSKYESVAPFTINTTKKKRQRGIKSKDSNKRGKYKCSHCGQMKSNHVCIIVSTNDVGIQAESSKVSMNSGMRVVTVKSANTGNESFNEE